jgi:hypothetical protein
MKTKTFSYISLVFLIAAMLGSCNDDGGGEVSVYMPQGDKPVATTFEISDVPYEITYTAAFAGSDYPTVPYKSASRDITVTFKSDASLVDAFNQSVGTDYLAMPEGSFSFESTTTINKGEVATPALKLIIDGKDKMVPFKAYLLPITIEQVDGAELSSVQQTTYFVLTGTSSLDDLQPFDRSQWTIAGFSSEEANGEGPGNGHAIHAIDNDGGTFWHTQWQGGEPAPPHFITIDMNESKLVHGILIDPRDHWQGQPAEIKIEISEDNSTWQNGGVIPESDLMNTQYGSTDDLQHQPYKRFLPFMRTGRYIRITVLKTMPDWNDINATRPNSTHIAEIFAL